MRVRSGQITDAKAIAQVHVASWRSTYKGIVPDDFLANLSYERRERGWRDIFVNAESQRSFVYVAENEMEKMVGFVNGGPERENGPFYKGELYAIYLLENYQNKGIGRQLVRVAARQLIECGFETMLVWVLADNPSCRFYERIGGRQVREKIIKIGGADLVEVAYGVVQEKNNEIHAAFLSGPARFLLVLFERTLSGTSALGASGKAGVKSCSIRSSIFFFRIGSGCTGSQIYSR